MKSLANVAAAVALATAALGACSSNPFSSGPSISDVDRVFLSGAGNWDRNRDGIVTCDEWKAYAAELFDAADRNHDGFIDAEEFASIAKTDRMFVTADFAYYDSAHAGKISRSQFIDHPNPAFDLLDKEHTCQLDSAKLNGGRSMLTNNKPFVGPPPKDQDIRKPGM
jgi:EF hand